MKGLLEDGNGFERAALQVVWGSKNRGMTDVAAIFTVKKEEEAESKVKRSRRS